MLPRDLLRDDDEDLDHGHTDQNDHADLDLGGDAPGPVDPHE